MPLLATHRQPYHKNTMRTAARDRLLDASGLLARNRWNGSVYLTGYAIEQALCVLLCLANRVQRLSDLPTFASCYSGGRSHNIERLLRDSGILDFLTSRAVDGSLIEAFKNVRGWNHNSLRYGLLVSDGEHAKDFLKNACLILEFLELRGVKGVLTK